MTTTSDANGLEVGEWKAVEPSLVTMQTDHLSAELEVDLGTEVVQDEALIGLSVCTEDAESNHINVFAGLTVAQARQLASDLEEAAAGAEASSDGLSTADSEKSTIDRLRGLLG